PGEVWAPSAKTKPVEWVKIHNLPDHVYFNHAQHVKVGGVACQTCHGEIEKMDEVKQFSNLSMGWCVNCHRNTGVDFFTKDTLTQAEGGNKFYKMYAKFHEEIQKGKTSKDKITVEKIGGTECQKCHY
ncbi:MAG: cytochrome c3 family protein, partial [Dinghuibacter sp.]|nr:cytochrome c3 family protein [Dinghuibacter sp.]